MITTKQKICMIRRWSDNEMQMNGFATDHRFKLIIAKIKKVTYGVAKTSVSSDKFYTLDAEELESNTKFINKDKGFMLVNEPFIINADEIPYFEEVVCHWNENPPKSIWEENYD